MEKNKHGYAVASLVLGILSIVLGCCWQIGLVLGVVGLVLAAVAKASGSSSRYGDDEDTSPKAEANAKIAPAAMKQYDRPAKEEKD